MRYVALMGCVVVLFGALALCEVVSEAMSRAEDKRAWPTVSGVG